MSSSSGAATGGGTTGTGGNESFAAADALPIPGQVDGDLDPIADIDFYKIDGKAGQARERRLEAG